MQSKGLLGEHGVTLVSTGNYVEVIDPPSADWISGLADALHYMGIGPTELTTRKATSLTVAMFANVSKHIRTYGSVTTDGGLTVKENQALLDAVEFVKSEADATSVTVQAPTVSTK